MKSLTRISQVLLVLTLSFLGWQAHPQSGSTVALIAGASAVGGPLAVQLVTGAKVDVDVDVYRETYPLVLPFNASQTNSPDHYRTEPFRWEGSPALNRMMITANDPVATPTVENISTAAAKLAQHLPELRKAVSSRQALADQFAAFHAPADTPLGQLAAELQALADPLSSLAGLVGNFEQDFQAALAGGTFSDEQLKTFANRLLAIRLQTELSPAQADYSPNYAQFFAVTLHGVIAATADQGSVLEKAVKIPGEPLDANYGMAAPGQTQRAAVVHLLWNAIGRVRNLDANGGKFPTQDGKFRQFSPAQVDLLKQQLDQFMQKFGYPGLVATAICQTEADYLKLITQTPTSIDGAALLATAATQNIKTATFTGLTTSANFGPIANEVMQSVFAQSRMIDEITAHADRWQRFNYVSSWGGAGNQNVVVYFENALTPVLKSATFDPSQFLAANAQIYQHAMDSLAAVYGVPTSGATSTNALASLNLSSIKARKTTADNARTATRQQMLAALKSLLDLHDTLGKAATGANGSRTWTAADSKPLQDAVATLQKISLQLENPKPGQP